MTDTNKPNETTNELERLRKARLKEAYKGPDSEPTENNEKKDEKKLDIDEKTPYLIDDEKESVEDKYKRLYEEQFKGDPVKAVKSWSETQREYMKLQNSVKEQNDYFDKLSDLVEKNPILTEILDKAESQEDVESFLATKFAESKQDKPSEVPKSKPNTTSQLQDAVDEKTLIDAGYLDASEKQFSNAGDWAELYRQASIRYMYNELPKVIAKRGAEEYEKQIVAKQKAMEQQTIQAQNKQIIEQRWLDGIDDVSTKYNLDFVTNEEHRGMLKDIERRAVGFRDWENTNVIDRDAVRLATERVLSERGLLEELRAPQPDVPKSDQLYDKNQFNVTGKREPRDNSKQSLADKLKQRHLNAYELRQTKRITSKNKE